MGANEEAGRTTHLLRRRVEGHPDADASEIDLAQVADGADHAPSRARSRDRSGAPPRRRPARS